MDGVASQKSLWSRWGLLQRVAFAQGLLLLVGAALLSGLLSQQHRDTLLLDQQDRAQLLLRVLAPQVAEQALLGDYAAVKQVFQRQATVYGDTSQFVWRRGGRAELTVSAQPSAKSPPSWFRSLVEIPVLKRSVPIELGGVDYGELEATFEPILIESKLWEDSLLYLWMTLGISTVILMALLLVLRANLRVLRDLATATNRFSQGERNVQIRPEGAREVHNAAVAFNNMTEQIRALVEELSESRVRLGDQLHFNIRLIESLPLPMYCQSPEGSCVSVNKAWEDFFGMTRAHAIGGSVRALYAHAPEIGAFHEHMDVELMQKGGTQIYEIPVRTRDGEIRQAMFSKTVLTNSQGETTSLIGIITDLTELIQAEQDAQKALVEKQAAVEASQAKSMFLANMSHEIRTPLTAIIGFSEALLDVNQGMSERIESIRTINRAGNHLLGVINDILDLSKIEAGRLEVESRAVAVLDMIDEVSSLAQVQAAAKGIEFRVETTFPLPRYIRSDSVRLRQVLLNLVSNAIKFTEQGEVNLRLRYDVTGASIIIDISDSGIGMTEEQISRLFQPFSQADSSTTRRFGGTGLGLALSKQLVDRLGGIISVSSSPGVGSCFSVSLGTGHVETMVNSADQAQQLRQSMVEGQAGANLSGTILVAEDNPDNQRLIALNTRRLGPEAKLVENGALAVAAALAQPYDLILMDMQMPVMDGLTAVRQLRARGYQGPIVALTANATQTDMQNCLEAGCSGFLTKPIDRNQFADTLRHFLGQGVPESEREVDSELEVVVKALVAKSAGSVDQVGLFRSRMLACHAGLQHAIGTNDREVIRVEARALKLAGVDYGCPRIAELAGQLEFAATSGNGAAVRNLTEKLSGFTKRLDLAMLQGDPAQTLADDAGPLVSTLLEEGEGMADLVIYFLTRLGGYERDLNDAIAAKDMVALKKKAHDLKSVGGGYGYPQISDLAIELERAAAENNFELTQSQVARFSSLARRVEAGAVALASVQAAASVGAI